MLRSVVGFGRLLRRTGLEVSSDRIATALAALDAVGIGRGDDVYWVLRQTLISRIEDVEVFDRAFAVWFGRGLAPGEPIPYRERLRYVAGGPDEAAAGSATAAGTAIGTAAASEETLRDKDFASLTDAEFAELRAVIAAQWTARPLRPSRRRRPRARGDQLDVRGLARHSLATGGDPIAARFRSRTRMPRRIVVLCDISGSMEAYTRPILLWVHALVRTGPGVEVFAFGTRLTRLTRDLRRRDPDAALTAAAERVVDWSGGTRIGESLREFNRAGGRGTMIRGSIAVIVSDGCDRGDPALVAREMARLAQYAYAVVWVNPLKGAPDYEPLAGGMHAALPYVDRFLSGHNLADLHGLAEVVASIETRHAA